MANLLGRIRSGLKARAPNYYLVNAFLMLPEFYRHYGRWPRRLTSEKATINDYLFQVARGNNWSDLHRRCVDKELAKIAIAEICPTAKTPRTIDVIQMDGLSLDGFGRALSSHYGTHVIAKPTHRCGGITFLSQPPTDEWVALLYGRARQGYFHKYRESQYQRLAKKVIVEEDISDGTFLKDYKFWATRGEVLFCQIDADRFTDHTRALLIPPTFEQSPITFGYPRFRAMRPAGLTKMIEIAQELSRPFDFVRVDLYDTPEGVYAGELSFTPEAGLLAFSDETLARHLFARIQANSRDLIQTTQRTVAQRKPF